MPKKTPAIDLGGVLWPGSCLDLGNGTKTRPTPIKAIKSTVSDDELKASIILKVDGHPRPQPRPRFVNGRVVSTVDTHAKLWRVLVGRAAREDMPIGSDVRDLFGDAALSVRLLFSMPTPASHRWGQWHTAKPDSDNLAKLVIDVLFEQFIPGNDSRVAELIVQKKWSTPQAAGCSIVIGLAGV